MRYELFSIRWHYNEFEYHRHTEHKTSDVRDKCVPGQGMFGETVSLLLRTPFRDKPNITNITALEFSEAIQP